MSKQQQKGFTLIELVIFIVLVGIIAAGLFTGLNTTLRSGQQVENVDQALMLAQQRMEMILGQYRAVGFAGFSDPCNPPIYPDYMCATGAWSFGYVVSSNIANNWSGNTDYKVVTVTVTGAGNATLTTVVGDYDF